MLQSINFVLANELYTGKPIASLTKYSKVEVDNATFETFIIELNNPTPNPRFNLILYRSITNWSNISTTSKNNPNLYRK